MLPTAGPKFYDRWFNEYFQSGKKHAQQKSPEKKQRQYQINLKKKKHLLPTTLDSCFRRTNPTKPSASPRDQAANPAGPAPMQLPRKAACPIFRYLLGLRDINAPAVFASFNDTWNRFRLHGCRQFYGTVQLQVQTWCHVFYTREVTIMIYLYFSRRFFVNPVGLGRALHRKISYQFFCPFSTRFRRLKTGCFDKHPH